jgi:hypothetical protein
LGYLTKILTFSFCIFYSLNSLASTPIFRSDDSISRVAKKPYGANKLSWSSPPDVVICEHAPIDEAAVKAALGWWKNLGYSFSSVNSAYLKADCYKNKPYGSILITLVSGDNYNEKSLATTTVYSNKNTNEILWVRIELKANLVKERVLEHEIGHALGWMHIRKKGHIMNEKLSDGGWGSDGLMTNINPHDKL